MIKRLRMVEGKKIKKKENILLTLMQVNNYHPHGGEMPAGLGMRIGTWLAPPMDKKE